MHQEIMNLPDLIFIDMKTLTSLLIITLLFSFSKNDKLKQVHFLAGTWKTENKDSYEVWKINEDGSMEGHVYKLKAGEKVITEYLSIRIIEGKTTYEAKALGQNNNRIIPFVLNTAVKDQLSFENPAHDFPKKIQYQAMDEKTILVSVLGDGDKGFRYKIMKQ